MEKIYCNECIYYLNNLHYNHKCKENIKKNCVGLECFELADCFRKNKNFDCNEFKSINKNSKPPRKP